MMAHPKTCLHNAIGCYIKALNCSLVFLVFLTAGCSSIGCYVCSSYNGNQPFCEDPFNTTYPNSSIDFFQADCMAGRKLREGLFPSSVCVKVKGKYADTGESLLIRTCAVDSDSLTLDTEISRLDQSCGLFDFVAEARPAPSNEEKARRLRGCIATCETVDGCNRGARGMTNCSYALVALGAWLALHL